MDRISLLFHAMDNCMSSESWTERQYRESHGQQITPLSILLAVPVNDCGPFLVLEIIPNENTSTFAIKQTTVLSVAFDPSPAGSCLVMDGNPLLGGPKKAVQCRGESGAGVSDGDSTPRDNDTNNCSR